MSDKAFVFRRRVIRWCDPVTITMIAGPNAVRGDTRRALMKRRAMFKLQLRTDEAIAKEITGDSNDE